jgi:lysozyme
MAKKRRSNKKKRHALHQWDAVLASLRIFWKTFCFTSHRLWIASRWTARMWWRSPRWFKWTKIIVIAVVVASLPLIDATRQWLYYREIYSSYYDHFYAEYSKTQPPLYANYYADYYADFYANYYSSPAYRLSLRYALPSATEENVSYPEQSPVASQRINNAGLALIKSFEGLELEPYADAGGKLTVGYGHLIKPGEFFTRISEQQAHELLRDDVRVAEAYVKRYVKVKLNDNQFAALVSLVYNIGPGNFRRSTLLSQLNKGLGDKAANEFVRWNKVGTRTLKGLTRRREAEQKLFQTTPS